MAITFDSSGTSIYTTHGQINLSHSYGANGMYYVCAFGTCIAKDNQIGWQIKYQVLVGNSGGVMDNTTESGVFTSGGYGTHGTVEANNIIHGNGNGVQRTKVTQTRKFYLNGFERELSSSSWTSNGGGPFTITIPTLDQYTISYNANGGTNAPQSHQKWETEDTTIASTVPVRSDYTFNSWNTLSDGTGTTYVSGDTYSIDRNLTLYAIWNPKITFNGNGGSGVPSAFAKTLNSSATIPSTIPTKDGYVFTEWNTSSNGSGTSYQPSGTIEASMNTAMTLYAIWQKVTAAPTISSITVIRCNSSGTQSDTGSYAKITAAWSVDRTYDSNNTGSVTGRYRVSGSSSYTSFSFTSGASGTSGTATAIVSGFDTDTQYEFIVKVTDTNRTTGHVYETERNVILTRAKFIMDLKAGGEAMGLFSAAPSEGLEIGKKTQIDDTLTVLGNVVATNLTLTSESGSSVATASGSFSVSSPVGYKYGPFRMVAMSFSSSSALAAETSYTLGSLTSGYSTSKAMGFANQYGVGYVSGTSIYFKPLVSVSASTSLYVAVTYIKP